MIKTRIILAFGFFLLFHCNLFLIHPFVFEKSTSLDPLPAALAATDESEEEEGQGGGYQFASSPNPVGSGARALGMGGAFIAVADDATAASWNPAGLNVLKTPEVSVVYDAVFRGESNDFGTNPEANGDESISESNINYLSITYPLYFLERPAAVSLNYQYLYDFNREWNDLTFKSVSEGPFMTVSTKDDVDYKQSGGLSTIGLAFSMMPFKRIPLLTLGVTLNFWDDGLDNQWEETIDQTSHWNIEYANGVEDSFDEPYLQKDKYWFNGFNANLGLMWEKYDLGGDNAHLKVGMVVKLPFKADVKHQRFENGTLMIDSDDDSLEMPLSYGLGISYRFPGRMSKLRVSADFYRTHWEDFILTSEGKEISPVTGKSPEKSDIEPTQQIRLGAEYRFESGFLGSGLWVFPLRAGLFYDPAPSQGGTDEYYGASLGFGVIRKHKILFNKLSWAFDIAYQYRFGNDVGTSVAPYLELKQDVEEHKVYASFIFYLPNLY